MPVRIWSRAPIKCNPVSFDHPLLRENLKSWWLCCCDSRTNAASKYLFEDTRDDEFTDAVIVVAEDLGEDLVRIAPHCGDPVANLCGRARQLGAR
jgi:hypothetical protein